MLHKAFHKQQYTMDMKNVQIMILFKCVMY